MSQYDGADQDTEQWALPGYDAPVDRPPSTAGSRALVAGLVTILVVVLCGGGVGALYLIGAKDKVPTASGPAGPTTPAASASASPTGTPSDDPNAILKGQCVVNDGTDEAPVLRVVACGPGSYQVLQRFDGTTNKDKCKTVAGSNFHYFYDTSPDTLDFVLCLKKL